MVSNAVASYRSVMIHKSTVIIKNRKSNHSLDDTLHSENLNQSHQHVYDLQNMCNITI